MLVLSRVDGIIYNWQLTILTRMMSHVVWYNSSGVMELVWLCWLGVTFMVPSLKFSQVHTLYMYMWSESTPMTYICHTHQHCVTQVHIAINEPLLSCTCHIVISLCAFVFPLYPSIKSLPSEWWLCLDSYIPVLWKESYYYIYAHSWLLSSWC